MIYKAVFVKQNIYSWLKQVNNPSVPSDNCCQGGTIFNTNDNICDGQNKDAYKIVKNLCTFGKPNICGACMPKKEIIHIGLCSK